MKNEAGQNFEGSGYARHERKTIGKCSWYRAHRHNRAKLGVVQVVYLGYDESIGPRVVTRKSEWCDTYKCESYRLSDSASEEADGDDGSGGIQVFPKTSHCIESHGWRVALPRANR